ncbi:Zn(II)2Cys6 transcription factor [Aspergillus stella-maris]|uniref:Zn(II)2Cys6 transcription factor n=1 Tax=Aspergillus stella-maris TaxID=1810926 RepID=UPI003CCCC65A
MENQFHTPTRETASISCDRCRRRKIKCDRQNPCSKCQKAGVTCATRIIGEKQRPARKGYVQALESQVIALRGFIRRLQDTSDPMERDELLKRFESPSPFEEIPRQDQQCPNQAGEGDEEGGLGSFPALARFRTGKLKRLCNRNAVQIYGGTSFFHIPLAEEKFMAASSVSEPLSLSAIRGASCEQARFLYTPQSNTTRKLMGVFFREQYKYNLCVYREYFLSDYHSGREGRYYSEPLLYAICAMGALAAGDDADIQGTHERIIMSRSFSDQAQSLICASFESQNPVMTMTTLQALLLLAQVEIGYGRSSKGWLLSGMAFRLAHEMGLHLDPKNWDDTGAGEESEHSVDRDQEILRRVYWATFTVDTQLSLYFGRPPALFPEKSDVSKVVRIPYPSCWETMLETYITGTSDSKTVSTESLDYHEDGIVFVGSFIYRVELYKILHTMITEVFENRRVKQDDALLVHKTQSLHSSLEKWASDLPRKLHWSQWSKSDVPACVLHLHMLYHTSMIILHRLPRPLLETETISSSSSEDVRICYDSLNSIIKLLKTFSRLYPLSSLPLDTVYILSAAAGAIFMKRIVEKAAFDNALISKPLSCVLDVMGTLSGTWPCMREIREGIVSYIRGQEQ